MEKGEADGVCVWEDCELVGNDDDNGGGGGGCGSENYRLYY